jgi:hypothetical protein
VSDEQTFFNGLLTDVKAIKLGCHLDTRLMSPYRDISGAALVANLLYTGTHVCWLAVDTDKSNESFG